MSDFPAMPVCLSQILEILERWELDKGGARKSSF